MSKKHFYLIRKLNPKHTYYDESAPWALIKSQYWYRDYMFLLFSTATLGLLTILTLRLDRQFKRDYGTGYWESTDSYHADYASAFTELTEIRVEEKTEYLVIEKVFK